MSLSASDNERKTTIINTPTAQGGASDIKVDAPEDREIIGYELNFHGYDLGIDTEAVIRAWTGNDPGTVGDTVDDNEQLYVRSDMKVFIDGANNMTDSAVDNTEVYELNEPFPWDRHVTLTVRVNEELGNQPVDGAFIVHYREV